MFALLLDKNEANVLLFVNSDQDWSYLW